MSLETADDGSPFMVKVSSRDRESAKNKENMEAAKKREAMEAVAALRQITWARREAMRLALAQRS
jgi:hypothetical protein